MSYCLVLLLLLLADMTHAAVRYIDDAGSNANDGTSTSTPWLTWAHAFTNTACGDTLIVMDGTYTTTNGAFSLTKACAVGTVYTITAQNERQAYIDKSGGTQIPIFINNSSYITVEGLRARGGDLSEIAGGVDSGVCNANNSNHITFRHMLCSHPNRYRNAGHVYQLYKTSDSLIEESEAHYFHRHGFFVDGDRNTFRRNYCNPRGYADLTGAGVENSTPPTGDDCFIVYPGSNNVIENNIAEGAQLKCFAVEATNTTVSNKLFGNICLGGASIGVTLDARVTAPTITYMPRDTLVHDTVVMSTVQQGYRFEGNKNTTCRNCTVFGGTVGFAMSSIPSAPGDGQRSGYIYNSLAVDAAGLDTRYTITGTGVYVNTTNVQTWSIEDSTAFNNVTNYNPASHANYNLPDTPNTTDPQMGTCKVWRPAGSAALTNDWGADILYRYENGVLTTIKLWDDVTGEFPHGAPVSGITDVGSVGAYNVHTRLNVNTGGCSFPVGYGGSAPTNPAVHHMFTGTGAISGVVAVPAGLDFLGAFIVLRDGGLNVGQVSAITSTCGSESFTLGARGRSHASAGVHNTEGWVRAAPTSGTCTISATTTGAVTSWIMDVFELDNSSGVTAWAANGSNGAVSATPTVTVPTNTSETVISATSGASACTISAGANQTALVDQLLSPMRLAVSEQSGNSGGLMDYTQGCTSYWATVGVSFAPGTPDPPSGSTFRVTNYRLESLHGLMGTPEVAIAALAVDNTPGEIGVSGEFRLRTEILVETATSSQTGIGLQCRKNAGTYARVQNTFGSGVVRFYGVGPVPTIPGSLTPTTQRFSGTFVAGKTLRDASSSLILPVMPSGTRTEVDFQLAVGNGLVADDDVDCQIITDAGVVIGTHTVTPAVSIVSGRSSMGF